MTEQTQSSNQQTIVIGLVVIAALLAVIVGVLVYQQTQNAIPAPTVQSAPTGAAGDAAGQQMPPTGMGGAAMGGSAAPAEFDPKTATAVPEGTEPEAFVEGYYKACEDGDWTGAFDALPVDKKAGNSPDALKEQVSGYGIKGFKITGATTEGDKSIVKVEQVTGQYGTFENTWTFVKGDKGVWLVESKAVTGMK
ncbi:MAG: hypothetical protein U1E26_02090 [Coriobacteriia bacterium]|nr:hypothetical protein [Coriobacteriia bacterium]